MKIPSPGRGSYNSHDSGGCPTLGVRPSLAFYSVGLRIAPRLILDGSFGGVGYRRTIGTIFLERAEVVYMIFQRYTEHKPVATTSYVV